MLPGDRPTSQVLADVYKKFPGVRNFCTIMSSNSGSVLATVTSFSESFTRVSTSTGVYLRAGAGSLLSLLYLWECRGMSMLDTRPHADHLSVHSYVFSRKSTREEEAGKEVTLRNCGFLSVQRRVYSSVPGYVS